jgi:hypothetical protein
MTSVVRTVTRCVAKSYRILAHIILLDLRAVGDAHEVEAGNARSGRSGVESGDAHPRRVRAGAEPAVPGRADGLALGVTDRLDPEHGGPVLVSGAAGCVTGGERASGRWRPAGTAPCRSVTARSPALTAGTTRGAAVTALIITRSGSTTGM